MPVLTAIDLVGIQRFVFASNRLRDIAGSSWLVHWAASREPGHAIDETIDACGAGTVITAAGGTALIRFDGDLAEAKANEFAGRYTRRLYESAPGLEAVVLHRSYDPGGLAQAVLDIQTELAWAKNDRRPHAPLMGLGVTAACRETGLPANAANKSSPDPDASIVPLSRQIVAARQATEQSTARLRDLFELESGEYKLEFPLEFEKLGATEGVKSVVGIVHIDGNGMGERFREAVVNAKNNSKPDDQFAEDYGDLSEQVDVLSQEIMMVLVEKIVNAIEVDGGAPHLSGFPERCQFDLYCDRDSDTQKQSEQSCYLPLRPILMGGDDLTFVCDGRIALSLAAEALRLYQETVVDDRPLSASAGVAIVPHHTPFARAYDLAEQLCSRGKAERRTENWDHVGVLDWNYGLLPAGQTLQSYRERTLRETHTATHSDLTCRPYPLDAPDASSNRLTWSWLDDALLGTGSHSIRAGQWAARRNKVKGLAEIVREGKAEVKSNLEAWQVLDANLKLPAGIDRDGFSGPATPLLDAIELMDVHLSLKPAEGNA